jgi:hypothetical protein
MPSRLIHPRMMQALERDFFPQLCTIELGTDAQDTVGQVKPTWAAVPGLTALKCRVGEISGGERRSNNQTYLDATHTILISGTYPAITEKHRAVIDGRTYDILLMQISPEETTTRLVSRFVR